MRKTLLTLGAVATLAGGGVYGADRAQNPYIDEGAHYKLEIVSDIPQGERVEIAKDRAAMTLKGWNDEYAITIEPQIPTAQLGAVDRPFIVEGSRPLLSKKMEYRAGDVIAFIEPRSDTEFDIDFTLHAKPDTNVFTYKITGASDFDFFYQPELTPEEIAEGASRPDNVVGSYAVYHKTKANHRAGSTNYATGKAFHIYRPKAIDANGQEVWADLSYVDGVLSVSVPQKFLDDAVYPVRVDPTFGYTTNGGTNYSLCFPASDTTRRIGGVYAMPENGSLDSMTVYAYGSGVVSNDTIDYYLALNIKDGTAADSHTQVALYQTLEETFSSDSAQTHTQTTASEALTSGTDYIINVACNGADNVANSITSLKYDSDVSATYYEESFTTSSGYANSKESPWGDTSSSGNRHSIYATYTASGGGGAQSVGTFFWGEE